MSVKKFLVQTVLNFIGVEKLKEWFPDQWKQAGEELATEFKDGRLTPEQIARFKENFPKDEVFNLEYGRSVQNPVQDAFLNISEKEINDIFDEVFGKRHKK